MSNEKEVNSQPFGNEIASIGAVVDPFSASANLASVTEPEVLEKEEKPKEPVKTVKSEENPEPTKVEKPKVDDEKPKKQETASKKAAYLIAEDFKKDGVIPEDVKLEDNLSAKDLKTLLYNSTKKEVEETVRAEYEQKYNPETLKTADLLSKGISPEELQDVNYYKRIASYRLGDDDEANLKAKEAAIRAMYQDMEISDKKIEKLVADAMEEDEGDSDFKEAQKYFGERAKAIESEIQESAEKAEKEAIKRQELLNKEIKSLIKSGDIYNTKDAKDQKELEKFLFENTETVKIDGKSYRTTGFQKKMQEYQNDLKQQLVFAKLLMNGFDLSAIEASGGLKKAEELDNLLEGTIENGKHKSDKEEEPESVFSFKNLQEIF